MPTSVITDAPYALAAGAGQPMSWLGSTLTLKASSHDLGVHEVLIQPGQEPPMHIHKNEDEWFYMLEGRMTFHVGDETFSGDKGAFVSFPRGIAHTFTVESPSARFLVLITPGGFERMFERQPKTILDAVAALKAYDCEVVGPHPRQATA